MHVFRHVKIIIVSGVFACYAFVMINSVRMLVFSVLLWLPASVLAGDFTVLTNQLPPIKMVEDGRATGIVGDVLVRLLAEAGMTLDKGEMKDTPLTEAYDTVRDRPGTIFLALVRSPQREKDFKWVGPVYTTTMGFIAKKSRALRIRKVGDMAPLVVGTIRGSIAERMAIDFGIPEKRLQRYAGTPEAVEGLFKGEIDLLAFPKSPAFYFMLQKNIDPNDYESVLEMQSAVFYIAFNRATDDALIAKLQAALEAMQRPGPDGQSEYDHIVFRYFRPDF